MLGSVSKDHKETTLPSRSDSKSSSAAETNFTQSINIANKNIIANKQQAPEQTQQDIPSQNFQSKKTSESQTSPLISKLLSGYLPSSNGSTRTIPSKGTEDTQQTASVPEELLEGYEEVGGTDAAGALEHFKDIEEPQDFGGGFVRFTTKDGKKLYVKESKNPQFFKQVATFYSVRQMMEKYPEHEHITKGSALPDIKAFSKPDQLKEVEPGVFVYETNDGKKGIIFGSLNQDTYNKALSLRDAVSEKEHAEAFNEIPEGYAQVNDKTKIPPFSEMRHLKEITVSDGSKILLFTTDENKKYAVSSIQTPGIFKKIAAFFVSAQQVDVLKDAGYSSINEQKNEYPDVRDIRKAGWSEGLKSGVTGYELKSGEKYAITAETNPDLYAHIQGVNEFLSAPRSHQDGVENLRNEGFELADIGTDSVSYDNIENIEIKTSSKRADKNNVQLTDPREGIITVTTKDGKKIVVSERLTPFLFEDLLGKVDAQSKFQSFIDQGFTWADEETSPPSLDDTAELVPVEGEVDPTTGAPAILGYAVTIGDKKYLMTPDQTSKGDQETMREYNTKIQNGEEIPKDLEDKVKGIKPIPFVQGMMDNQALKNIPEDIQNKIKALSNSEDLKLLTPSDPVITLENMNDKAFKGKIGDIDTKAAEKEGIIEFTIDGKKHAVSRDFSPQEYAYVEAVEADRAGMDKSLSEGYRKANDGDFEPDIKETSKPGEFGQGVMRFTTESGEKIVVSAETDPYLFDQAMTAYQASIKEEIDSVWEKYDLPPRGDFILSNLPTNVTENGQPKSVHSIAFSKVLNQYAALNNAGELSADDPRAKLLRFLGHEQLLTGGMDIIPYIEDHGGRIGNDTVRKHKKDGSGQGQSIKLTKADMAEMINGPGLENALQDLLKDPQIAADMDKAFQESINLNVDKDGAIDKLNEQINNPDFINALTDLKISGNNEAITQITNEILTPAAILMPDKVQEMQNQITNAMTLNLIERNLQDSETIPDETKELARNDAATYTVTKLQYAIENASGIDDKNVLALKDYLAVEDNAKKMEGSISEFVKFAQDNPDLNPAQAAIDFVEAKTKDGSLAEKDLTALKTMLLVMENSNYTEKLVGLTQVSSALYHSFDGGKDIAPDAMSRMDFIENSLIPSSLDHFMLGEKTKELLSGYTEDPNAKPDSQNFYSQNSPTADNSAALRENAAASMNVMAMMNSWQMNIGSGSLEALMGIISFTGQRGWIKAGFENDQAYDLLTASEVMMMAGGGVQGVYGVGQVAVKYAPNSVVQKYSPQLANLNETLNNPLSNITNSVQIASSFLFGGGMLGMGISGFFSKYQDALTKAGNSLSAVGGGAMTVSGGMQGAGIYAAAAVNRAQVIMQATAAGTTAAKISGLPKVFGVEKSATRIASAGGNYASRAAMIANIGSKLGIAGLVAGTVAGAVFGGQMIQSGIKTGDNWMKAAGGLNVAGSVIAGVATVAAMMMGSVVLAGVGILAFIPGLIISLLLDEIRGNPELTKINGDETKRLQELEKDGFLREGAWDKFEFARYYTYHEGRKELNDDESYIETQQEMWDHFKETPGKNGSSENRLNWDLHKEA